MPPRLISWLWILLLATAGCTTAPSRPPAEPAPTVPSASAPALAPAPATADPTAVRYRCEQDLAVSVNLTSESATVDAGPRGKEVLLRDAGGVTPHHTVFSNSRLRAEFGVGPEGREALLHWLQPEPLSLRCRRAV